MGFFDGLSRLIQGKPVFESPDDKMDKGEPTVQRPIGKKELPVVDIVRVETDINGQDMTVYGHIKNESDEAITLDKICLLGTSRTLGDYLMPRQQKEIKLFDGDCPSDDNNDDAYLEYKDPMGDYFQAKFFIEYQYHADTGLYSIEEFKLEKTIKDI